GNGSTVSTGTDSPLTLDLGLFQAGQTYTYTARGYDGTDYSGYADGTVIVPEAENEDHSFIVECDYLKSAALDPDNDGTHDSHSHDFFGNPRTTTTDQSDLAAYMRNAMVRLNTVSEDPSIPGTYVFDTAEPHSFHEGQDLRVEG